MKAVIFDMDGVLVETEPFHTRAVKEILEEAGIDISEDEILEYVGLAYPEKLKIIFSKKSTDRDIPELLKKIHQRYRDLIKGKVKLMEGALELIEKFSNNGFKIALVTASNDSQTSIVLSNTDMKKYFDIVVTSNDVKNKKPDPECYLLASKKLEIKPDQCLVIEDSVYGVTAAKKAGMKCIALTSTTDRNKLKDADLIVDSLNEIDLNVIKKV